MPSMTSISSPEPVDATIAASAATTATTASNTTATAQQEQEQQDSAYNTEPNNKVINMLPQKRHATLSPPPPSSVPKTPYAHPTNHFQPIPCDYNINDVSHLNSSSPASPPSTPFRFTSFPASLPRLGVGTGFSDKIEVGTTETSTKLLLRSPWLSPNSKDTDDANEATQDKFLDTLVKPQHHVPWLSPDCHPEALWKRNETDSSRDDFDGEGNVEDIKPYSPAMPLHKNLFFGEEEDQMTNDKGNHLKDGNVLKGKPLSSPQESNSSNRSAHSSVETNSSNSLSKSRKHRPMPDMSAFDVASSASSSMLHHCEDHSATSRRGSGAHSPKWLCPPTPVRTPAWAHHDGMGLGRTNSLIINKMLASCPTQALDGLSSLENSMVEDEPNQKHDMDHLHLAAASAPSSKDEIGSICFDLDFVNMGALGSGAFADVYKARCIEDNQLYAIKRNRRQFRGKRDRDLAMVEVQIMQKLQPTVPECHAGEKKQHFSSFILKFIRAWQEDGHLFCQTELCCRNTCQQLLSSLRFHWREAIQIYPSLRRNQPPIDYAFKIDISGSNDEESYGHLLPESTIWKICHDVTAGLSHIHSHGIVHHDIKPLNIFFVYNQRAGALCKIGDFGMARHVGAAEDGQEGDTRFMPQELLTSALNDPSGDIFSLGLSLYELASSGSWSLPSEGPYWHEIRNGNHVPELPSCRSKSLTELIQTMISPKMDERPTADDIISNHQAVHQAGKASDTFLNDYIKDVDLLDQAREKKMVNDSNRYTPTKPLT